MLAARRRELQSGKYLHHIHPIMVQLAHDAGQRLHSKARQLPAHGLTRTGDRHLHKVPCSLRAGFACLAPERAGCASYPCGITLSLMQHHGGQPPSKPHAHIFLASTKARHVKAYGMATEQAGT